MSNNYFYINFYSSIFFNINIINSIKYIDISNLFHNKRKFYLNIIFYIYS